MKRILGVEGGGTKTEWLWMDEGGAPARSGTLGPANLKLIGDEALERLLGVLPPDPTHVGLFMAGCTNGMDRRRLRLCARRIWPKAAVAVGTDRQSGFATAFGDGDGVAVIAGTGSAITGRHGNRQEKAGGWGHVPGDKGSGYDISVQALRQVLWNYDLTRRVTPLGQAILSALALNGLEDLISWANSTDKMSVAKLAPVVFAAAAQGDPEMGGILDEGAKALADGACAVAGRLGLETPVIKVQGGLFAHHPHYVARFTRLISSQLPRASVSVCTESGAFGALWLAARHSDGGVEVPPSRESEIDIAEMAAALTEQANPRSAGLDRMSTPEIVDIFISEEVQVGKALAGARNSLIAAVELVADALRKGGRLFYVGAGTSGRLGVLDASEIPPTFGADPQVVQAIMAGGVTALYRSVEGAEDQPEGGALALLERGVHAGDIVCGIAASGRTPFVMGALKQARELGARSILVTCNTPTRRNGALWDIEIGLFAGPEILAGSTRLKAGTATKCALNILSTATMVRLGHVHGNLMSGVLVSNDKLRDRAIRLVSTLRGIPRPEAEVLLERHSWDVRRCV